MTAIFFELPAIVPAARIGRYEWFVPSVTKGSYRGIRIARMPVSAVFEQQCSNASSTQSGLSVIRYLRTAALSASFKLGNEVVDFMNAG